MIEWYRNGEFYEDDIPEEIGQIKIGDRIKMKNNKFALWSSYNDQFENSGIHNNSDMGTVKKIKNIRGYECVYPSAPQEWYKIECVEKQ